MRVGLGYFLALSAILFSLGVYGAVSKRGMVMVLMSLELIAMSVNLNLVAFARFVTPNLMTGQYFAIFAMVVSAAEIGIGLALVLAVYKQTRSSELNTLDRLKG